MCRAEFVNWSVCPVAASFVRDTLGELAVAESSGSRPEGAQVRAYCRWSLHFPP